jgi:ariadne-1
VKVVRRCLHLPACRYKRAVDKGEVDEQEQRRQHARQSLERYMHYWQRWAENDTSRKRVRCLGAKHTQQQPADASDTHAAAG